MVKFSGTSTRPVRPQVASPVTTTDQRTVTFEGGGAYSREAESDLFLLAASNMVGENTYYETAEARDRRFVDLVHKVTKTNPAFIAGADPENGKIGLAEYLRRNLLMRSASIVLAAEYVRAGGPNGRSVVARVLQRPDEPAEMIGYWISHYGRNLPMPIKRGVADAVRRLYNEKNLLKYDGQSKGIRFADVIELTHPKPAAPWQNSLFRFALDRRHHEPADLESYGHTEDGLVLNVLAADAVLMTVPEEERRTYLRERPEMLNRAGWTWERLAGWLPGGMDAEAWEFILPQMTVGALLRNLRNFDKNGISDAAIDKVIDRITNEDLVARGRLFPYQVWTAYREAPSDNWKRALAKTLQLATRNIPDDLDGSLVVVDCSGSMGGTVSNKSTVARWEVAAVGAAATVVGTKNSDVVIFGDRNAKIDVPAGTSALRVVERIQQAVFRNEVGSTTYGHTAIRDHFDPARHKRVFLFTDDQMMDSEDGRSSYYYGRNRGVANISHVPLLYTVDLSGYAPSSTKTGKNGRHALGGFSDASFTLVRAIEMSKSAQWPF